MDNIVSVTEKNIAIFDITDGSKLNDFGVGNVVTIGINNSYSKVLFNGRTIGFIANSLSEDTANKAETYCARNKVFGTLIFRYDLKNVEFNAKILYCDSEIGIIEVPEYALIEELNEPLAELNFDVNETLSETEFNEMLEELKRAIFEEDIVENTEEEKSTMISTPKRDYNFGGKITDGRFRMSINGLTVRTNEGTYVTYDPAKRELVEVTTGFFDQLSDLLFYMPTMELEKGDIILHQDNPYYITEVEGNTIKGVCFATMTEDVLVPKTNLFGQTFYVKVFNCLGTNNILSSGLTQNPMMAYMLMGEKDLDLTKLMMLQSMSGEGVTDFSGQPWMMMALMSKENGGDFSDIAKMSMLAQMNKSNAKGNSKVTKETTAQRREN